MKISVASLTLRFYKRDGWNKLKIRKLLVDPKMEIVFRKGAFPKLGNSDYYAVYEDSGFRVFKKSETDKHTIEDKQNFGGVGWYIEGLK